MGLLDGYPGLGAGGNIDLNQLVRPPDPLGAALAEMSQRFATAGQASRLPVSTLGAIGSALGGAGAAAQTQQTQYLDQAIKLQALKKALQQAGIDERLAPLYYQIAQRALAGGSQAAPGAAAPAAPGAAVPGAPGAGGPFTLPNVPNYGGTFGPVATPDAPAGLGGGDQGARARMQLTSLLGAPGGGLLADPGGTIDPRTGGDLLLPSQGGAGAAATPSPFRAALVGNGAGDGAGAAADLVPGGGATAALRGLLAGSDSGASKEDPLAGLLGGGGKPDEVIPSGAPPEDMQLASMRAPRSEADIIRSESGGNPNVGYGGVDLTNAPRDPETGFPQWAGKMGPAGISHAAGLYQFQPGTYAEGAKALGIKDFSPESQKAVYDWTRAKYGDAPWQASEGGGLPIMKAQYAPGGGPPAGSGAAAVEGMLGGAPALVGAGSGQIPGLGMTPQEVAILNAMSSLARHTNPPLKEFLDIYYKSPEYLRGAAEAQNLGQRAVTEPSDIRIAQAKAVEDRVSKQIEQGGAAMLDLAPNGILVPDGRGGQMRVQATRAQAVRAANGLAVPELGIAGMYPDTKGGATAGGQPTRSVGPIAGEPVQTPAQAARDKAAQADFDETVAKPFQAGQKALFPLNQIENALQNYQTGAGKETELDLKKSLLGLTNRLGIPTSDDFVKSIASGEIIRKSGNALGFELARSLGSREAENIVNQAIQSNPGLAVSPTGNVQLIGLIKQGIQRDFDKHTFYNQWFDRHGTYVGADDAFNASNPVESYVQRVLPKAGSAAPSAPIVTPYGTIRPVQ